MLATIYVKANEIQFDSSNVEMCDVCVCRLSDIGYMFLYIVESSPKDSPNTKSPIPNSLDPLSCYIVAGKVRFVLCKLVLRRNYYYQDIYALDIYIYIQSIHQKYHIYTKRRNLFFLYLILAFNPHGEK